MSPGPGRSVKNRAMNARHHIALSVEHMALGWAWHDAKNAAALACELLRWATPKPNWVSGDDSAVAELDERFGAEQPVGGDPFREPGTQRVNADPPEVTDARFYIATVTSYVGAFVEGRVPDAPLDYGQPEEHPLTRLYWYASYLGSKTVEACNRAASALKGAPAQLSWSGLGEAAKCATEFIRKFATSNPVIGAADGSAAGTLNRIGGLLAYAGKPNDEIVGHMFYWRMKDALKGAELSPDLEANLFPAFQAAWTAGEYEFAYSLFDDLATMATP